MEAKTKKKVSAVAIATAVILVLAGTIAYLADASGMLRNQWDPNHVEVDIAETDINKDDGKKDYTIIPGATDEKDPKITVDTDTDAYVFAVVKDNINNAVSGTKYVDYDIADGWIELTPENMNEQTITKYLKTFEDHKVAGDITINPQDANTKIYYRVVHGNNTDHRIGPFSVLKDDQVHYPSTLSNADLDKLAAIEDVEKKQLIFATYAIQMDPFCDPAETDATKITAGAKDAWNQQGPVEKITVAPKDGSTTKEVEAGSTLELTATVEPSTAKDKSVTWTSSDNNIATVDANGVVTGVAAGGPVTITATNAASGVKGTYEVTVTEPATTESFGYAVQFHGYEDEKAVFWPAMGEKAAGAVSTGVTHNNDAAGCIHHDDWTTIKSNLATNSNYYDECISNGCTKKVVLGEDAFDSDECGTATLTTGDGGGMVYDGLTHEEAMWEKNGDNTVARPSYNDTLDKIKSNSNLPASATMFLLRKAELEFAKPNAADRVIYDNSGGPRWWWLADRYGSYDNCAYSVDSNGGIDLDYVNVGNNGIAPGFSY